MSDKRQVPPGSREEAQVAESALYGILHALLLGMGPIIAADFNYEGADVHATGEGEESGVWFDGLTIRMASGDYRVTITQERAR